MEQHFGLVAQGCLTWFVNDICPSMFSSNLLMSSCLVWKIQSHCSNI